MTTQNKTQVNSQLEQEGRSDAQNPAIRKPVKPDRYYYMLGWKSVEG